MANTLLKTIRNFFVGKKDELNEALSNPLVDGRVGILDAKNDLATLSQQLHDILASSNNIKKQKSDAQHKVDVFDQIAVEAGKKGIKEDVINALTQKKTFSDQVAFLDNELAKNKGIETSLNAQISNLSGKTAKAEIVYDQVKVSIEADKIREKTAKQAATLNVHDPLEGLQKAADKQAASADAWETINSTSSQNLEEKYNSALQVSDEEINKYLTK